MTANANYPSKIWDCDQFLELNPLNRLLYIAMITFADDEGRLRGDGGFLKKYVFNRDKIGLKKIEKMRDAIASTGLIVVYESRDKTCIAHPNWFKYQTLDKRRCKPSDFLPPPEIDLHAVAEQSHAEGKVSEFKSSEENVVQLNPRRMMLDALPPALKASLENRPTVPVLD